MTSSGSCRGDRIGWARQACRFVGPVCIRWTDVAADQDVGKVGGGPLVVEDDGNIAVSEFCIGDNELVQVSIKNERGHAIGAQKIGVISSGCKIIGTH